MNIVSEYKIVRTGRSEQMSIKKNKAGVIKLDAGSRVEREAGISYYRMQQTRLCAIVYYQKKIQTAS